MDYQSQLQTLVFNKNTSRGLLHAARAAIGALPIITRGLLAKANKKLRLVVDPRASTGSTDCQNYIRLPLIPMPQSDVDLDGFLVLIAIVYGLLHHEVGHCNHSGYADFLRARKGLERSILNIIEDVRMENVHIQVIPASRRYLDALCIAMASKGYFDVPSPNSSPVAVFQSHLLFHLYARYRNEPIAVARAEQAREVAVTVFTPDLVQRLDDLLEVEFPALACTRDAFELSRKVVDLLQDAKNAANGQGQSDSSATSEPDQTGQRTDSTSGANDDPSPEKSDQDVDDATEADDTAEGPDNSDSEAKSDDQAEQDSTAKSDEDTADANDDPTPENSGQDDVGTSDADDGDAQDGSEGEGTEDTTDDAGSHADADSDDASGSSASATSSDASGSAGDSGDNDQAPASGESQMPDALADRLQALLSTPDDAGTDRHDAANQLLQEVVNALVQVAAGHLDLEDAISDLDQSSVTSTEPTGELHTDGNHDLAAAHSAAIHIRRKMQSELDAIAHADTLIAQRGRRLSDRHLHRAASGDPRVFRCKTEGIAPSTAVLLVEDVSGSMQGNPIRIASQALYATAIALEGIDGIEVAAMAFPGNGLVLDFGQSPRQHKDRFQLSAWGSTPMGEAIHVATHGLLAQPQQRKLMIVNTDGDPDDSALALTMIATAESFGIEVYGVGICTPAVQRLFRRWIQIDDVNELPAKLVQLVRNQVMQSLAA